MHNPKSEILGCDIKYALLSEFDKVLSKSIITNLVEHAMKKQDGVA